MIANSIWTDERIEKLTELWVAGHSAADISDALHGVVSRSAVIGKANRLKLSPHRHGLTGRGSPFVVTPRKRRTPRAARIVAPTIGLEPEFDADLLPGQSSVAVALLELTSHHCRYPIDQPTGPMMYCGAEHVEGSSWCPRHWQIVYQPARKPQKPWIEFRSRAA